MEITLKSIKPSVIPPVAKEGWAKENNISDDYFAVVKSIGGDLVLSIVRYDHKRNRWLINRSGCVEIVEYYKSVE